MGDNTFYVVCETIGWGLDFRGLRKLNKFYFTAINFILNKKLNIGLGLQYYVIK